MCATLNKPLSSLFQGRRLTETHVVASRLRGERVLVRRHVLRIAHEEGRQVLVLVGTRAVHRASQGHRLHGTGKFKRLTNSNKEKTTNNKNVEFNSSEQLVMTQTVDFDDGAL